MKTSWFRDHSRKRVILIFALSKWVYSFLLINESVTIMFRKKKKEKFENRVNQLNRVTDLANFFYSFDYFLTKEVLCYKPVWKEGWFTVELAGSVPV